MNRIKGFRHLGRGPLLATMAGLMAASLGSGAFSLAFFTDSETLGANTFTTGTIDLTISPTSALVTYSTMMPGDSVTAQLTVSNGTGAARYAMTTSATNADSKALRDQITLTVKTKTANPCSSFDGTTIYTGALSSAAIGDPTSGAQAGDRALAASASEDLCFRASLPSATGNAYQGAATTATFTFTAEQTANNP